MNAQANIVPAMLAGRAKSQCTGLRFRRGRAERWWDHIWALPSVSERYRAFPSLWKRLWFRCGYGAYSARPAWAPLHDLSPFPWRWCFRWIDGKPSQKRPAVCLTLTSGEARRRAVDAKSFWKCHKKVNNSFYNHSPAKITFLICKSAAINFHLDFVPKKSFAEKANLFARSDMTFRERCGVTKLWRLWKLAVSGRVNCQINEDSFGWMPYLPHLSSHTGSNC